MPVRRRTDKRATRADFEVSEAMLAAFDAYVASEPVQPVNSWPEYWRLAEELEMAGAPVEPLLNICCWHPQEQGSSPAVAVAVYRRLSGARKAK